MSSSSDRDKPPTAARWLVAALLLGLIGFIGYTFYDRYAAAGMSEAALGKGDARVEGFLRDGGLQLKAGDHEAALVTFQRASGVAEHDPRVHEGLVQAHVLRAETAGLKLLGAASSPTQRAALGRLIDKAHAAIAAAGATSTAPLLHSRLQQHRLRLSRLLLLAHLAAGDRQAAESLLSTRLAADPQIAELRRMLDSAPVPTAAAAPLDSASPTASATASASAAAPAAAASPAAPAPNWAGRSEHYELDHEPVMPAPATPGELQLPAPAPAPTPAPPAPPAAP